MRRKLRQKINSSGNAICDVCKKKNFLIEHHIRGRKIPKPNHSSNLCYICSNCHTDIHRGVIVLEGWIMTNFGNELFWHFGGEDSFSGDDAHPYVMRKDKQAGVGKNQV